MKTMSTLKTKVAKLRRATEATQDCIMTIVHHLVIELRLLAKNLSQPYMPMFLPYTISFVNQFPRSMISYVKGVHSLSFALCE